MAAILVMAAIGAWTVSTDRISYVVTDGISMQPLYHAGDLVIVVKADSYVTGQIVAYRGRRGLKVLHRIVGGDAATGFVFKGDNNPGVDLQKPTAGQLIGHAVLHIPKGGVWLKPVFSPVGLGMMGFLIVSGGAALPRNRREVPRGRRKKKVKAMDRQGGLGAIVSMVMTSVKRLPPIQQVAAGLVACLVLVGLALGVFGWIAPAAEVKKGTGPIQSMVFSYSAAVPRSAAYDGTAAVSPDPIFRRLAHKMTLLMHYQGSPGTFTATANLTTGSGWHTTLELAAPRRFSSKIYETAATLDLDMIDARARAADKAIGVTSDGVSVAVSARVEGATTFTAPLQLTMTPVLLSLNDGQGALTVTNASVSKATTVVRKAGFLTAAAARAWAVFIMIVAAFGAGALYLLGRRSATIRTRADIERRYPQHLVHVEPMASPPGKPVVTVDNFPALVKLAERYGQMILTWRRPDADDFVVRDEGITYRYRVLLDEPTLVNVEHLDRPPEAGNHRRRASSEVS